MKKSWRGLSTLTLLLVAACSSGEAPVTETILPEISSQQREFSMQLPADGTHFLGHWSGSLFDGRTYRNIFAEGGSLRFILESTDTLLMALNLRAEAATNLEIHLNGKRLKELPLKPSPPADHRILLPRRLLRPGVNRIDFIPDPSARIRFYRLALAPPDHRAARSGNESSVAAFQLPAALEYHVRAGHGRLQIGFSKPIPRIRLTVGDGESEKPFREWTKRDHINLDLTQWPNELKQLRFQLEGPALAVDLTTSEIARNAGATFPAAPEHAAPPGTGEGTGMNVLVILMDSARADRLSCAGYSRPTTPHIDQLAKRAWRFDNAWAEAAYTLASTATLFSGLAPDQHNAVSNYFGGLNERILTLAEIMRAAGYHTAAVSAIPYCGRAFQMEQGFETFIELFQDQPQPLASEFPAQLERIIDNAATKGKPFFAYLHIREPHIDYVMPPPYFGTFHKGYSEHPNKDFLKRLKEIYFARGDYVKGRYTAQDLELLNDAYDENLLFADAMVGRMLQSLAKQGLAGNTAVVVLGDHGEGLGEHGEIGHNTVLYPEGLHIPIILAIPGWSDNGAVLSHPVSTSDLTASLIRIFNGPPPADLSAKGLFQIRPTPTIVSRSIFFSGYHNAWSIVEYPYQAILTGHGDSLKCRVFNLARDPGARSPLNHPLHGAYFWQRLVNTIHGRRRSIAPTASNLKRKEIESLKSLGYL